MKIPEEKYGEGISGKKKSRRSSCRSFKGMLAGCRSRTSEEILSGVPEKVHGEIAEVIIAEISEEIFGETFE